MNKSNLIILVIIGIVFFIVGGGLGIFYQTQKDASQINGAKSIKALSSKVIPSIVAYGKVTDINGRDITIFYNGESLTIPVSQDAQVSSFSQANGQTGSTQQKTSFDQIKKGNYINISIKVLPDGNIEGNMVIILPQVGS
jgi:hypothetical protein